MSQDWWSRWSRPMFSLLCMNLNFQSGAMRDCFLRLQLARRVDTNEAEVLPFCAVLVGQAKAIKVIRARLGASNGMPCRDSFCPCRSSIYVHAEMDVPSARTRLNQTHRTPRMSSAPTDSPHSAHQLYPRDRKSTRLNSSHSGESRMPSSA